VSLTTSGLPILVCYSIAMVASATREKRKRRDACDAANRKSVYPDVWPSSVVLVKRCVQEESPHLIRTQIPTNGNVNVELASATSRSGIPCMLNIEEIRRSDNPPEESNDWPDW
jgi:hypothetical protein